MDLAQTQVEVLSNRALREYHACGGEDTADSVRQASEAANRAAVQAKRINERYFATKKKYDQQIEELKHAADDGIGDLSALQIKKYDKEVDRAESDQATREW
eukprot:CAMPEP_0197323010 /NCGR_PEP_ID=MMETSP0891-20130614/70255_1 /TAXON_ID=44058 ORGANISM="Aureoumbra lagunensis, Strain CCMP1510" /NCGR_SAMPLE_ID=MMETSP0891 /ASSEMBLY_ACC=CAM_ASM_000534 /LENGTH=101 /DNA_ID=CAMNT_0042815553 /DNA_START=314 /DNA_END=616 /DNA_ORIENTATION=+